MKKRLGLTSRFVTKPAEPWLKPFVHSYWGITRDLSKLGGFTVTPDRFPELMFFDDPPFVKDLTGRKRLPACTFIGLLSQPLHLEISGTIRCASVRLYAWSAGMILRNADRPEGREWFGVSPSLARWLPRVQDALRRCAWREIPSVFDAALADGLSSPPSASEINAARACLRLEDELLDGTKQIANSLDYSRRQVERQVRAVTGISPKKLSSLVRFQFVRDTLWANPHLSLVSLAIDAGYADQAHMTREFRRYSGQTPLEFRRTCARLKRVLTAENVALVQDQGRKVRQGESHDD